LRNCALVAATAALSIPQRGTETRRGSQPPARPCAVAIPSPDRNGHRSATV
jgi:hypothetical protein